MKTFTYLLGTGILLLAQPSLAQNTVLTTSGALPGGGVGAGNVVAGPGNSYPAADAANFNVFVGQQAGVASTTGDNNSFLGYRAGYSNTTGNQNSILGFQAGYYTSSGSYNSFLGALAGFFNTTGTSNSFMGYQAGYSNTTGYNNSFTGSQSGYSTTTGHDNSFTGYQAGFSNTMGSNNSFMGYQAGYSNTTGNNNSFTGYHAGYSNTTGYNNSFLGYETGLANTSGRFNLFVGSHAGWYNTSGGGNSFVGVDAGAQNTFGSENSFMGLSAGFNNTSGSYNSFMGYLTGNQNSTGSNNSFFGNEAGSIGTNIAKLQRATALGNKAKVGVDDGLVLGDTTNVKVGIGTAYPNERLTLRGNMNFVAFDNSMMLKNRPFLHFNERESLALGLGSEIAPGVEKTLVLGSKETTVQIPGIVSGFNPNSGQFLTVDDQGNVRLSQPRVQVARVADWSDKVFEPGYALQPLGEVEDFVKTNKHLPGVPSAEAMVADGMESAAFNAKLLEKIEELTLYLIELKKENEWQRNKNKDLETKLDQLEKRYTLQEVSPK